MHSFESPGARQFRNFLQQCSPLNDSNTRNTRRKYREGNGSSTLLETPETLGFGNPLSLFPDILQSFSCLPGGTKLEQDPQQVYLLWYDPCSFYSVPFLGPQNLPVCAATPMSPPMGAPSGPRGNHSIKSQALRAETPQRRWRAISQLWSLPPVCFTAWCPDTRRVSHGDTYPAGRAQFH